MKRPSLLTEANALIVSVRNMRMSYKPLPTSRRSQAGARMADLRNKLTAYPGIRRITATSKDVHETLLNSDSQMFVDGTLYEIKAKSLGAGVYRVWLEKWKHGYEAKRG